MKVENELFYRACDELGLLVIQDMPAMRPLQTTTLSNCVIAPILPDAAQQVEFGHQLARLVNQLKSFPSIAIWVCEPSFLRSDSLPSDTMHFLQTIYNEGWGQITTYYPEFGLTAMIESLDPTRLVDSTTGWWDHGAGDFSVSRHTTLNRSN